AAAVKPADDAVVRDGFGGQAGVHLRREGRWCPSPRGFVRNCVTARDYSRKRCYTVAKREATTARRTGIERGARRRLENSEVSSRASLNPAMKIVRLWILFILLVCGLGAAATPGARAQTAAPPRPAQTPAPQDEVQEGVTARVVRVPVTVLDKKGQPVTGLTRNDFLVFEDKRP